MIIETKFGFRKATQKEIEDFDFWLKIKSLLPEEVVALTKQRKEIKIKEIKERQKIRDSIGCKKRRAKKLKAIPKWSSDFDAFVMQEAAKLAKLRQKHLGMEFHVDHCIPLQGKFVSGLHCADNLQVIPASQNLEKGNKLMYTEPLEWLFALDGKSLPEHFKSTFAAYEAV